MLRNRVIFGLFPAKVYPDDFTTGPDDEWL